MLNYSGLKAILEAQILTSFLWIMVPFPLKKPLNDDVVLEGDMAQHC